MAANLRTSSTDSLTSRHSNGLDAGITCARLWRELSVWFGAKNLAQWFGYILLFTACVAIAFVGGVPIQVWWTPLPEDDGLQHLQLLRDMVHGTRYRILIASMVFASAASFLMALIVGVGQWGNGFKFVALFVNGLCAAVSPRVAYRRCLDMCTDESDLTIHDELIHWHFVASSIVQLMVAWMFLRKSKDVMKQLNWQNSFGCVTVFFIVLVVVYVFYEVCDQAFLLTDGKAESKQLAALTVFLASGTICAYIVAMFVVFCVPFVAPYARGGHEHNATAMLSLQKLSAFFVTVMILSLFGTYYAAFSGGVNICNPSNFSLAVPFVAVLVNITAVALTTNKFLRWWRVLKTLKYESAFKGNILPEEDITCVGSWPGIFAHLWDELTRNRHVSAAVVFLPENHSEDYGQHADDCWCQRMYGLPQAPWGCKWFELWKDNIRQAGERNQTIEVVYMEDSVGNGHVVDGCTVGADGLTGCARVAQRLRGLDERQKLFERNLPPARKNELARSSDRMRNDVWEPPGTNRQDKLDTWFKNELSQDDRTWLQLQHGLGRSQKFEVAWLDSKGIAYERVDVREWQRRHDGCYNRVFRKIVSCLDPREHD